MQFRFADVRVAEYSGLDPVNPLDTSASAAGKWGHREQRQPHNVRSERTDLRRRHTSSVFVGGTNGFTSRIITPMDGDIAGDKFVGTAGTYAATANQRGSSAAWVMQAAAFRDG